MDPPRRLLPAGAMCVCLVLADIVHPVMADDQPPKVPSGADQYASGSNQAWTALGYLIGGMVVWGLAGWLVDRWLHLSGIATAVGIVLGVAGGVVLIVRRFAVPDGEVPDGREDNGGRRR